MSKVAWYSWAAAHLVDESLPVPGPSAVSPSQLIPIGEGARLIFGHNVSYDRARVAEEYSLRQSQGGRGAIQCCCREFHAGFARLA